MDAIVLAVVSKEPEGTYGYRITQDVRRVIDLSESTLYPVLRRLQKDECLEVYDMECAGRNRRYYKVTSRGWAQLQLYESEWRQYAEKVTGLFEGRLAPEPAETMESLKTPGTVASSKTEKTPGTLKSPEPMKARTENIQTEMEGRDDE